MNIKILSFLACLFALNVSASSFYQTPPDTVKPSDTLKVITTTKDQDTIKVRTVVIDTITMEPPVIFYWEEKNAVGFNLSEVAFVNWNAGGNNSISALFHGNFERNYEKGHLSWKNRAGIRYGINSQEGQRIRKTEDEIVLSSTFGYRKDSLSNWYYSGKFNFNTQIANGYKYPERDKPISSLMAPGYLFLGIGSEYNSPDGNMELYLSPITQKSTFVLNQRLANEGMFGVQGAVKDEEGNIIEEGENVRTEIGILFTSSFKRQVFENINLDNQLSLYSDYLNNFGNVDVDWQLNVNMKVNDFVKAQVGSHLRYDNDVKYKEDTNGDGNLETFGARVQFKQMLGVGLIYEF